MSIYKNCVCLCYLFIGKNGGSSSLPDNILDDFWHIVTGLDKAVFRKV